MADHSVKRDGTGHPDIVIQKDGTVIYREEIMGRVGKDYRGWWYSHPEDQYSADSRRFATRRAAINCLILSSGNYPDFVAAGVQDAEEGE